MPQEILVPTLLQSRSHAPRGNALRDAPASRLIVPFPDPIEPELSRNSTGQQTVLIAQPIARVGRR
jgi:hypothetical protein